MSSSPTSRSLAHARSLGYLAAVTERWNPHARVRQDLFGFIDLVCIKEGEPPLGIQATSGSNHASRVSKSLALPSLAVWLGTGARFQVWSWAKRKGRWSIRIQEVALSDITHSAGTNPRHDQQGDGDVGGESPQLHQLRAD